MLVRRKRCRAQLNIHAASVVCRLHMPQVKGAEKVLFGLNDIAGMPEIIIVEGEMDKLALEEAGFCNVVGNRGHAASGHMGIPAAALSLCRLPRIDANCGMSCQDMHPPCSGKMHDEVGGS